MNHSKSAFLLLCVAVNSPLGVSCGGKKKAAQTANEVVVGQRVDDQSRCEYEGREDRDVRESSAPGSVLPNIRRVYGYIGSGVERRRILLCREVDTNFDGQKDLFRTYGDNGEKLTEQADADYDGKIDTWITFGATKPAKIEIDKNADGEPDEHRFYTDGHLVRIQRDTNGDKKPDIFEIYREGRLERMGLDLDYDGSVDEWRRDEVHAQELQNEQAVETPPATEDEGATEQPDGATAG